MNFEMRVPGNAEASKFIQQQFEERLRTKQKYIEIMAAAYIKATGIPATECCLYEQTIGTTIKTWIGRKDEIQ